MLGDYPMIPMPTIESEINLIESFSGSKLIGIAINHEDMTNDEVNNVIEDYERKFCVAATDILTKGSSKLVGKIISTFPELKEKIRTDYDGNTQTSH
jgi:uncharacterized NAD-dependent epimerase/dehydratase family protein